MKLTLDTNLGDVGPEVEGQLMRWTVAILRDSQRTATHLAKMYPLTRDEDLAWSKRCRKLADELETFIQEGWDLPGRVDETA